MSRIDCEVLPAVLRELLDYDPETGALTWRTRDESWFASPLSAKRWNIRFAGKPAFTADNGDGYKIGTILYMSCSAHRIAYAHFHGAWPEHQIDHINGDRTDNRIENLRSVTNQENCRNRAISSRNRSGVIGVAWSRKDKKWTAQIMVDNRAIHLGSFDNFQCAVVARKAAEQEHGFHKNHGRAICSI